MRVNKEEWNSGGSGSAACMAAAAAAGAAAGEANPAPYPADPVTPFFVTPFPVTPFPVTSFSVMSFPVTSLPCPLRNVILHGHLAQKRTSSPRGFLSHCATVAPTTGSCIPELKVRTSLLYLLLCNDAHRNTT